jgi:galacturan 1,4-alpha-galacturonidase
LDAKYTIAQPLDLTFLNTVDIVITGEISFTPDIPFWVANSFRYTYQTASLFWQIGGTDVNIYGGGTTNGNGQVWWDALVTNSTLLRPILMGIIGLQGGSISNLKLINPPNWFHFVANSSDLIFDNMSLTATSNDTNAAKNSGECPRNDELGSLD